MYNLQFVCLCHHPFPSPLNFPLPAPWRGLSPRAPLACSPFCINSFEVWSCYGTKFPVCHNRELVSLREKYFVSTSSFLNWTLSSSVEVNKRFASSANLEYHATGNNFERFRGFSELISRFEFDFHRCGKLF